MLFNKSLFNIRIEFKDVVDIDLILTSPLTPQARAKRRVGGPVPGHDRVQRTLHGRQQVRFYGRSAQFFPCDEQRTAA